MNLHKPVLLHEAIEYLNLVNGKKFIDATLDGGGHTVKILQEFPNIHVLGIEWDPVEFSEFNLKAISEKLKARLIAVNDSYANMRDIVRQYDFSPDAVLFDLGVSSWHYEKSGRGFSFQKDEVLDMRFNPDRQERTAAQVVNGESVQDLERMLSVYGEEQFARQISKAIVAGRSAERILTTEQLAKVISGAVPEWYKHRKLHFATKTFQAVRMEVNGELDAIKTGVQAAIDVLVPSGRLAVISFHGLEDKAVREVFKKNAADGVIKWATKDTIKPKWAEVKENPRARSAKMKVAEKV